MEDRGPRHKRGHCSAGRGSRPRGPHAQVMAGRASTRVSHRRLLPRPESPRDCLRRPRSRPRNPGKVPLYHTPPGSNTPSGPPARRHHPSSTTPQTRPRGTPEDKKASSLKDVPDRRGGMGLRLTRPTLPAHPPLRVGAECRPGHPPVTSFRGLPSGPRALHCSGQWTRPRSTRLGSGHTLEGPALTPVWVTRGGVWGPPTLLGHRLRVRVSLGPGWKPRPHTLPTGPGVS